MRLAAKQQILRHRRNIVPALLGTALVSTAILFAIVSHDSHHAKALRERLLLAMQKTSAWLATDSTGFSPFHWADRAIETAAPSLGRGGANKPADPAVVSTKVAVGRGDTLMKLLLGAGADASDSSEAVSALRAVVDPKRMQLGQEITLTFSQRDDQMKLVGLNMAPSAERSVALSRGQDGSFAAKETVHPLAPSYVHSGGTIDSSLFQAAQDAGVPAAVMSEMVRLFSYDVDFQREVKPGDSFEVYFERMLDGGGHAVKNGDILYAAMTLSGHTLQYYRYKPSDQPDADYFNANGQSIRKALLRTPVDGAKLTSGFGMRLHPLLGFTTMHKGVDFGAPYGTPIMAAGDGTVEMAGWFGAYGKYVRIRHNATYSTVYAHMSAIANLRVGEHVHQGQVIGYVGATGRATGPHLHYEVHVNDVPVNPLSVRLPSGRNLDGKELARFHRAVDQLTAQMTAAPLSSKLAGN
ncbi:MAG TPA: peptidoglycan DD-metalloendopeptidase family protein [Candidatus Sulfotelmatobacter sp.]|nr:peptidoglycan DD-metalloendopeptidase family protein [Candidatus Sulfotelmatobacter sp.]